MVLQCEANCLAYILGERENGIGFNVGGRVDDHVAYPDVVVPIGQQVQLGSGGYAERQAATLCRFGHVAQSMAIGSQGIDILSALAQVRLQEQLDCMDAQQPGWTACSIL